MLVRNESTTDRVVRAGLGGLLLLAGTGPLARSRFWRWRRIATLIGLVLLFTASTGTCLIYRVLGISTREEEE